MALGWGCVPEVLGQDWTPGWKCAGSKQIRPWLVLIAESEWPSSIYFLKCITLLGGWDELQGYHRCIWKTGYASRPVSARSRKVKLCMQGHNIEY